MSPAGGRRGTTAVGDPNAASLAADLPPGTTREIPTPHGPARVHLHLVDGTARGALLLGHGAGGGVGAPDLRVAARAALAEGVHVALVEQPYRVAGRRAPAPARQLDAAWLAVAADLRAAELAGLPLLFGGRSSGARVACRTSAEGDATGVVCLAFPVHPPGKPEKHRLAELAAVRVPVLVVQGDRDPFGRPDAAPGRAVVLVAGDHSLSRTPAGSWTPQLADFLRQVRATGAAARAR